MLSVIKFNLKGGAPEIFLEFFGGMRMRYHVMLLNPKVKGEIIKEWRGFNWDQEPDNFKTPVKGNALKLAPLGWQIDILPNPNIPGEKYRILFEIKQGNSRIFLKEYEKSGVGQPEIIIDDALFVPEE